MDFLSRVSRIPLYGIDVHLVSAKTQRTSLGIQSQGILIRQSETDQPPGEEIKWSDIKEFRYRENRFTLLTKNPETTYNYTLETTAKARNVYLSTLDLAKPRPLFRITIELLFAALEKMANA